MRFLEVFVVLFFALVEFGSENLSARKIESSEIDFLNIALESLPHITARLKLTKRNSLKVCRLIKEKYTTKSFSKREIEEHLKEIIDPVKTFFNEIKEFKMLVLSLIRTSLIESKEQPHDVLEEKASEKNNPESKKAHKQDNHEEQKKPEPFLMKFINASLDIEKFAEHEITSQENLKKICIEFIRFITDIEDSLTPTSEKSYQDFMKKLKDAKDTPLEHKTSEATRLHLEAIWNEVRSQKEEICPIV